MDINVWADYWRRIVALTVLLTFLNSLVAPVFAADVAVKKNKEFINEAHQVNRSVARPKEFKSTINVRVRPKELFSNNEYNPYLEFGGVKYFNQTANVAGIYDLFIPLLQSEDRLLFADLRIFDHSGSSAEGNLHLGYRRLVDAQQLFGLYGAFDYKRSARQNSFYQLTLGFEYWYASWFVGANIYKPIGVTKRYIGATGLQQAEVINGRNITEIRTTTNKHYEEALPGIDAELGYALTESLTSYVGGYYFAASDAETVAGPKIRITYDYIQPVGRILGVVDGISLEVGAQRDKPRGNIAYVGLKFKVGLTSLAKNSNVSGFKRHMVELVRRDPDIIVSKAQERFQEKYYQDGERGFVGGDTTSSNKPYSERTDYENWPREMLLRELGLLENASYDEIRKAYYKLSLIHHPDKARSNQTRQARINGAYAELKNRHHAEKFKSHPVTTPIAEVVLSLPAAKSGRIEYYGAGQVKGKDFGHPQDIRDLDYRYSNLDIEKILSYRLLEAKSKELPAVSVISPMSQTEFTTTYNYQPQLINAWLKQEVIAKQKKIILPIYLAEDEHWVSTVLSSKNSVLEIKYLDSLARYHSSQNWLAQLFKNFYDEEMNFVAEQPLQQVRNSMGCGAFAIENAIRGLNLAATKYDFNNSSERDFRVLHYGLVEKYKNQGLQDQLGLFVVNLENMLFVRTGRVRTMRGGGKIGRSEDDEVVELEQLMAAVAHIQQYGNTALVSEMLTNFIVSDVKNFLYVDLLVTLDKEKTVVEKIAASIYALQVCPTDNMFRKLAALLPFDTNSYELTQALIYAYKFHGYIASIEELPYFTRLWNDELVKSDVSQLVITSLETALTSFQAKVNFPLIQKYLETLLEKDYQAVPIELPRGLIQAIFQAYANEPNYFTNVILDILAEDKYLPPGLLELLIEPLNMTEPKAALFMALRLLQNNIILPEKILRYFLTFLSAQDESLCIAAINLFGYLDSSNFIQLQPELGDILLTLLPKVSGIQRFYVNNILDGIALTKEQEARCVIQESRVAWHVANNFAKKKNISTKLASQITEQNVEDLLPFFRENLLTQNSELLKLTKAVLPELKHQELFWAVTEQKILSLLKDVDITFLRSWRINELVVADDIKFILTAEQARKLHESGLKEYIQRISFLDFREIDKFLDFVAVNAIDKDAVQLAGKSASKVSIIEVYRELLKNLVAKMQLTSINRRVLENSLDILIEDSGWPADFLFSFIKQAISHGSNNTSLLLNVVTMLADYGGKINPEALDRHGLTAYMILKEKSLPEMLVAIDRLRSDNSFFVEMEVRALLAELERLNPNVPLINELCRNFVMYFAKIKEILEHGVGLRGIAKPLANWRGYNKKCYDRCSREYGKKKNRVASARCKKDCDATNDFLKWRQAITEVGIDKSNITEVLAVLSQAAHNTILIKKYYPRAVQLLAVLALLSDGVLAEIGTGEGKTLTLAMVTVIRIIQGRQLDIVTSSNELARRDATTNENISFYSQFGINIAHNTNAEGGGNCYTKDVVYGDPASFIGDILRDDLFDVNNEYERAFDLVAVDEVDSMFLDNNEMLVMLATTVPGFEVFNHMFVYMYHVIQEYILAVEDIEDIKPQGCYIRQSLLNTTQPVNLLQNFIPSEEEILVEGVKLADYKLADTCGEFIRKIMRSYVLYKVLGVDQLKADRLVIVPSDQQQIAEKRLDSWIESLMASFAYEKKVHYIVNTPNDKLTSEQHEYSTLEIVDGPNSGTIMYGLQWENGLHQFLQIANSLTVVPEHIVTIFLSYYGFFNKYNSKDIYGVTGTLGGMAHKQFLRNVYGVDSIVIPPFAHKDLVVFAPVFARTKDQWFEEILYSVYRNSQQRHRATLIIVDTMRDVEELYNKFVNADSEEYESYDASKIITYSYGGSREAAEIKKEFKPGDVVIATNLAGRGTDLKNSPEVVKHGGLHVIKGSFSSSKRVEDQAIGRAARQGEPGSAQLIINLEQLNTMCVGKMICLHNECTRYEIQQLLVCLHQERDDKEMRQLVADELVRVRYMKMRDKLYGRFIELLRETIRPTRYQLSVGKPKDKLEDLTMYLYKEEARLKLQIVDGVRVTINDITEVVKSISPHAERHLSALLASSQNTVDSLNKVSYELMHFIAASNDYPQLPDIYRRIEGNLAGLVVKDKKKASACGGGKDGYLRWLLANDPMFVDLQPAEFTDCQDTKIDELLLRRVELRKTFSLWKEDRSIYINKAMIKQLIEKWGWWLKHNTELLLDKKYNTDTEEARLIVKAKLDEIEKKLEQEFFSFKETIKAEIKDDALIQNPAYFTQAAWNNLILHGEHSYSTELTGIFARKVKITGESVYLLLNKLMAKENYAVDGVSSSADRIVLALDQNSDLLGNAIGFCEKVIKELDPTFWGGWAVYNARAIISLS